MKIMIVWLGRWMEDWQSGFLHRWNYSRTKSEHSLSSGLLVLRQPMSSVALWQWWLIFWVTHVISCGCTVGNHFYVRQPISCWRWCLSSLVFLSCLYLRHCVTPVGQHEWPDGCAKELIGGSLGPFHQPVFHPRASCTHWEIMQIYTSRTDIFPNLFQWHLDRYRLCHPPKTMLACAKSYFPPCWIAGYKATFSELS